jgi:hypothetical protein
MKIKVVGGSIILALIFIVTLAILKNSDSTIQIISRTPSPTPFRDFQAAFAIVTNGTHRTFTASMYFNQSDLAYITEDNPNIIQVKAPNLTWQQFFDTLPLTLSPTCLTTGTHQTFCTNGTTTLRFFLNGTENPQSLQKIIQPKDRLLISYGVSRESDVLQQLNLIPLVD